MTTLISELDNPVWHALTNQHAALALGDQLARRYPADVGPFGSIAVESQEAFEHLAALVAAGETVVLVNSQPVLGETWTLLRQVPLIQMVYEQPLVNTHTVAETEIQPLSPADVPAMLQLVEQTHPGPFAERTIALGRYLGIWQDGQLAAMAGERFHLPGYCEISAVCTHPNFQRRGYARQLIEQLIHDIQGRGETPFLHVVGANTGAQALYESMGFNRRANFTLFVLKRQSSVTE